MAEPSKEMENWAFPIEKPNRINYRMAFLCCCCVIDTIIMINELLYIIKRVLTVCM